MMESSVEVRELNRAAALIVDLDNTLYNFDDAFAKSARALVHAVSKRTGVEESTLEDDIRRVLGKHGALEYPGWIEDLDSLRPAGSDEDEQQALHDLAVSVFRRVRSHNLKLFPGVRETLKWVAESEISLIALSDAPAFQAEGRLRYFKLDGYFDALISWEGIEPSNRMKAATRPHESRIETHVLLDWAARKPNPEGLSRALDIFGVSASAAVVVGDNVSRDVAAANAIGAFSVWAAYGTKIDPKSRETINRIFPGEPAVELRDPQLSEPWHVIQSFSELRPLIGGESTLF